MLFQFRLLRQHTIQASVQPRVVDLAFLDMQDIAQRCGRIPPLLDRQLAARRTQPVDRQYRGHP
jgi:hypothetical protein